MPVTPFHFGVGMVGKGLFPRRVSLTAFVVSQVAIDLEVAYFLLISPAWPFYRWAHTVLFGGAIGVAVGVVIHLAFRGWLAWRGARWQVPDLHEASLVPAIVGGLLGGLTHPVFDGIMHDGIAPLRPFSTANPFKDLVSYSTLHVGLALLAALGVLLLVFRLRPLLHDPSRR
jgi:hypothetical protein